MDWKGFVNRLKQLPANVTNLALPCPPERIAEERVRLGSWPSDLAEMLIVFNGGELFVDAMPFVTIFGLSLADDPPELEWSIDKFTPKWRAAMQRPNEWIIGITNYGGIFVADENNVVREWDSAQKQWTNKPLSFDEWADFIFVEGQKCLNDE